jgi:signal transduction histidine kinase
VEFDRYKIVVIDRGRGMTREQIEAVGGFMQFERRRYEQQGTGLGLVIAQRIATLAGGEMRIESAGAGGTSVTLTVPVAVI